MTAGHNSGGSLRQSKHCEVCGVGYERPVNYSAKQWSERRCCSRKCGRVLGAPKAWGSTDFKPRACHTCGAEFQPRSGAGRYCEPCRSIVTRQNQRNHYDKHRERILRKGAVLRMASNENMRTAARSKNEGEMRGLSDAMTDVVEMEWIVRVKVPFTSAASKNSRYGKRKNGEIYTRTGSRSFRDSTALAVRSALNRVGQPVVSGKLWLGLYIQKPNHQSDAVNVVDVICDAIQDATGLNDRWYSIRRLDWQIALHDPHIIIEIGQEYNDPHLLCSSCGAIKPEELFLRPRAKTTAVYCDECRSQQVSVPSIAGGASA